MANQCCGYGCGSGRPKTNGSYGNGSGTVILLNHSSKINSKKNLKTVEIKVFPTIFD
jgi:hypothetical protein